MMSIITSAIHETVTIDISDSQYYNYHDVSDSKDNYNYSKVSGFL